MASHKSSFELLCWSSVLKERPNPISLTTYQHWHDLRQRNPPLPRNSQGTERYMDITSVGLYH